MLAQERAAAAAIHTVEYVRCTGTGQTRMVAEDTARKPVQEPFPTDLPQRDCFYVNGGAIICILFHSPFLLQSYIYKRRRQQFVGIQNHSCCSRNPFSEKNGMA